MLIMHEVTKEFKNFNSILLSCPLSNLIAKNAETFYSYKGLERWLSGLKRSPAKRESGESRARGFESLSLHQSSFASELRLAEPSQDELIKRRLSSGALALGRVATGGSRA